MNSGKLQESVLSRSVLKQLHKRREEILLKPQVGIGYQVFGTVETGFYAMTTNVLSGPLVELERLVVHRGVNSLVCTGAKPLGLMLAVTLPEEGGESVDLEPALRHFMQQADADCAQLDIEIMGGHTQVDPFVRMPVITVTALGLLNNGAEVDLSRQRPRPGQDIVMTKWAGLSGTWQLLNRHRPELMERFTAGYLAGVEAMPECFSVRREAELAISDDVRALFDLSEGGIFGALWEAAAAGKTGLLVDLRRIPLRQETVEICNLLDVNPYQLVSLGALLIASDHGERLVKELSSEGIEAAVIGQFTEGNDRKIMNGDEIRYLEPPRAAKII